VPPGRPGRLPCWCAAGASSGDRQLRAPGGGARPRPARAGTRRRGAGPARLAVHHRDRAGHRPRGRPAVPGRRGRRPARRDAPQTPHRVAPAAGVRGHQRQRDAGAARGGHRRRGGELRVHQQHQRLRPGAHAAAGRAGDVDHRGRHPGSQEHLRGDQGGGRGPVRDHRARPGPARGGAACGALLSRGR
jgi:hypothetical protein